jgi:cell division protein FtsX
LQQKITSKSIFFVLIFVCLKNIRWEKDTISRPFLLLGTALAFYCSIVFVYLTEKQPSTFQIVFNKLTKQSNNQKL